MSFKKVVNIKINEVTEKTYEARKKVAEQLVLVYIYQKSRFIYLDESGFYFFVDD